MKTFEEYREIIEDNLLVYMPDGGTEDEVLFEAMKYSLTAGGKRLRPVMTLAASDMAGGNIRNAVPFAVALEYIHTYSLIHDDLPAMDDDEFRRGRPTNHTVYGAGMATLAGDGLLSLAFDIMTDAVIKSSVDGSEEVMRAVRAMKAVSDGAGVSGMVSGQAADLLNEKKEPSEDALLFIDRNKTGAMIKGAILAGLFRAGAGDEIIDPMTVYAEKLGLAFQIADDILDVTGTVEELGKNPGADEARDKLTWVSLYGLDNSRDMLHRLTEEAAETVRSLRGGGFFIELVRKLENRSR